MMELSFYKLRLFRSDFLLVQTADDRLLDAVDASAVAKAMCSRRRGVGASGLILLGSTDNDGTAIRLLDSDGVRRVPTADSLLCAARYLFDSGRTDGRAVPFASEETQATVEIIDSKQFRIDLGRPVRSTTGEAIDASPNHDYADRVLIDGRRYYVVLARIRDSYMIFIPLPVRHGLREFDRGIHGSAEIADHTPLYVRPSSPEAHRVYTWPAKRLVDCCELVGVSVVASNLNGYSDGIMLVRYGPDSAFADWNTRTNDLTVTASPEYVFVGEFHHEDEAT
jgi:hypothetical protein